MNIAQENMNPIYLAENIRLLRKQKSWSQEELATKVGLNRGNIASYEKGMAEPKICNLLKISKLFGVSIIDLTKRDLRGNAEAENKIAIVVDNSMMNQAVAELGGLSGQVEELQTVVDSIYTCHCHKIKRLEELPRDVQMLVGNFEHLHEVAQQILQQHKQMVNAMEQAGINLNLLTKEI